MTVGGTIVVLAQMPKEQIISHRCKPKHADLDFPLFSNEISFCTKPWEDDIYSSAHKETALWGPLNGMEKAGTRFPQLDESTNVKKKIPKSSKTKKNIKF